MRFLLPSFIQRKTKEKRGIIIVILLHPVVESNFKITLWIMQEKFLAVLKENTIHFNALVGNVT